MQKRPSSLKKAFLSVFLLAVGVPLLFLLRLGWDNFQQSRELGRREILDRQRLLADGWLSGLFEYRQRLRKLGSGFIKAGGQELAGSRDPRLWMGISSKFFERLRENPPPNAARHTRAYARHLSLYNQRIVRNVSLDPSTHNEMQSPLKVQFYALEHSALSDLRRVTTEETPQYKPFLYRDLMREAPPLDSVNMADEHAFRKWLGQAGLFDWYKDLPFHPVIHKRTSMGTLIWDEAMGIVSDLIRNQLFTARVAVRVSRDFRDLMRLTVDASRRQWLPFKLFSKELEFYWDTIPPDWDKQKWLKSESQPLSGIYVAILDRSQFLDGYFESFEKSSAAQPFRSIFETKPALNLESTPDSEDIAEKLAAEGYLNHGYLRRILSLQNMSFEILSPPREDRGARRMWVTTSGGATLPGSHRSLSGLSDMTSESFRVHEVLRVLDPDSGRYRMEREDLLRYGDSDLKALVAYLRETQQPVQFTFDTGGETSLGTLHPARELGEPLLFFHQPQKPLVARLQHQSWVMAGGIFSALLLAAILGWILSRKTLRPVLELTSVISELSEGGLKRRATIQGRNEIAELAHDFNQMAETVQERIWQIETVQELHLLFNQRTPRQEMLGFILQKLRDRMQTEWSAVGFFPGRISMREEDWVLQGEGAEEAFELIQSQEFSSSQRSWMIKTPKGPVYVSTVWQKAPEGLSGEFRGIMLHARPAQNCQEAVDGLLEQARTAMVKSILDEIRADTMKGWEIQESLMPAAAPTAEGRLEVSSCFVAARGLAGDYFDYVAGADPDVIGIAIADVSGKGIGPSLFGATSRASLRVLAQSDKTSGEQLTELNSSLCYRKSSTLFLTMFYARFLLSQNRLEYASAGHNRMFLIRRSGEFVVLSAKGLPAGVFDGGVYQTCSVDLEDGDLLVLYTDGVTEHENAQLQLYGDERFEAFLKANFSLPTEALHEQLLQELSEHRQGVALSDDVTFVFARYHQQGVTKA